MCRSSTIATPIVSRTCSSDLRSGLRFGYTSNEVGFGWTNAAVLDLLAGLHRGRIAGGISR
jgi:alpha,alpha-trehalase